MRVRIVRDSQNWKFRLLFMIKYMFDPGPNSSRSLQRFLNWTPPDGTTPLNVWMATAHSGFLLAESTGAGGVLETTAQYADVARFEIYPVLDSNEGVPALQRGFEYAAAH
jgi:hypothetical protein